MQDVLKSYSEDRFTKARDDMNIGETARFLYKNPPRQVRLLSERIYISASAVLGVIAPSSWYWLVSLQYLLIVYI